MSTRGLASDSCDGVLSVPSPEFPEALDRRRVEGGRGGIFTLTQPLLLPPLVGAFPRPPLGLNGFRRGDANPDRTLNAHAGFDIHHLLTRCSFNCTR